MTTFYLLCKNGDASRRRFRGYKTRTVYENSVKLSCKNSSRNCKKEGMRGRRSVWRKNWRRPHLGNLEKDNVHKCWINELGNLDENGRRWKPKLKTFPDWEMYKFNSFWIGQIVNFTERPFFRLKHVVSLPHLERTRLNFKYVFTGRKAKTWPFLWI